MPMEFGTCLYWVERRATMQRLSESWRELSALGAGAGTTHLASDSSVEKTANAIIQVWRLLSLQSLPPARQVQAGLCRSDLGWQSPLSTLSSHSISPKAAFRTPFARVLSLNCLISGMCKLLQPLYIDPAGIIHEAA